SDTLAHSTAYAARLTGALGAGALANARVTYRLDAADLEGRAILYLPVASLQDLLDTLGSQEDVLGDFAVRPTLDRLVASINQGVGGGFLPAAFKDPGHREA